MNLNLNLNLNDIDWDVTNEPVTGKSGKTEEEKQDSLIFGSASLGTGNTGRGDLKDMMAEWEGDLSKEYL